MPRFLAFMCNDDNLTPVALRDLRERVAIPSTSDSSGFGFGWLQDGRSLLRTTPKPSSGVPELLDLMSDARARTLLGHILTMEEGSVATLDLQPFRFRRWIVAHAGEVVGHAQTLAGLKETLPSFVAANIKGSNPSEILSHVFLAELHRLNLIDNATNRRGCGEAMAKTVQRLQVEATVAELALAAISERSIVAAAIGRPLRYYEYRGLSRQDGEPLFAGHKPKRLSHPTFKALALTDGEVVGEGWKDVPDGHVLWVDDQWNVQLTPIAE